METESKTSRRLSLEAWKGYSVQVSLILVSILIAFWVDRTTQGFKSRTKTQSYLAAIQRDLQEEIEATRLNVVDCEEDLALLTEGIREVRDAAPEVTLAGAQKIRRVFARNVFRSFAPTSFELMASSGDALLIESLELRRTLAAIGAFRNDYIKRDLFRHDELLIDAIDSAADYVDVACLQDPSIQSLATCVKDIDLMRIRIDADFARLVRHTEVRRFHLARFVRDLEAALPKVEAAVQRAD